MKIIVDFTMPYFPIDKFWRHTCILYKAYKAGRILILGRTHGSGLCY